MRAECFFFARLKYPIFARQLEDFIVFLDPNYIRFCKVQHVVLLSVCFFSLSVRHLLFLD